MPRPDIKRPNGNPKVVTGQDEKDASEQDNIMMQTFKKISDKIALIEKAIKTSRNHIDDADLQKELKELKLLKEQYATDYAKFAIRE